jgi:hypothetical protein
MPSYTCDRPLGKRILARPPNPLSSKVTMDSRGGALLKILRAYKTELDPNHQMRTLLLQHAGARRWAYN